MRKTAAMKTAKKKQAELAAAQSKNTKIVDLEQAAAKLAINVNALKIIGHESSIYAANNGGLLPTDFGQFRKQLAGIPGSRFGLGTSSFEFFNYGTPLSTNTPGPCLYAREKLAPQMPDGQWSRTYLFIDGSVQVAESDDGNFDRWEKDWLQSHQSSQQAGQ